MMTAGPTVPASNKGMYGSQIDVSDEIGCRAAAATATKAQLRGDGKRD